MKKSQLVDWLADELNISRREAKCMVDGVLEGITHALLSDGHLTLRGFGTFEVRRRSMRGTPLSRDQAQETALGQSGVSFRPSAPLRGRLEARADQS